MKTPDIPIYSLWQLTRYFLQLGTIGFGGPVALVGYMYRDLVEQRKWISDDAYKQGLALAQLAPGPLAAQLSIYLGFVHYGLLGATLVGVAFVLPSFLMVLLIGWAYQNFGGLPWMQSLFYGISAAVIGIIAIGTYKLTTKTIGAYNWIKIKQQWLLWLFFGIAALVTYLTRHEPVWLFVLSGGIYMLVKSPPLWTQKYLSVVGGLLWWIPFSLADASTLSAMALFFAKAGAFVFGSGLAIVPFLHAGVVDQYHWLTERQFVDAVAVAMITPGPVVITVAFIGYLTKGLTGASVAALATFLPCYLFTIILAPYFQKISENRAIKTFVEGITASVVGALAGAVLVISGNSIIDVTTALLAIGTIGLLLKYAIPEPYLILGAAIIGWMVRLF
jgi:chromate transporter